MAKKNEEHVDAGHDELQKSMDEINEQGFMGTKVDPLPNERYALTSGPDSPTIDEQRKAVAEQE